MKTTVQKQSINKQSNAVQGPTDTGWIEVESSVVHAVLFDFIKEALFVRFSSGKTYMYQHLPVQKFYNLMAAKSKGARFNQEIRQWPREWTFLACGI